MTATYQLFITFGILVACTSNPYLVDWFVLIKLQTDCISIGSRNVSGAGSWQTVVGLSMVWPFMLGIGILFMPESPRFVVMIIILPVTLTLFSQMARRAWTS
jgi:MFS transporter, SP family, sugar:H+ symporter